MIKLFYYINSLIFCLRYLPFAQAIKIPILVWYDARISSLHRGDIVLTGDIKKAMVLLGFEGGNGRDTHPLYIHVQKGGHLFFGNDVNIARGTRLVVSQDAKLQFGDNFFCNGNCSFYSNKDIIIKDNCLFGWNIELNTTDGHTMIYKGIEKNTSGNIILGNHVWVCSDVVISKNVTIADNCVIGRQSLVTKSQEKPSTLIVGIPAKVIKSNINWNK